MILGVTGTRRGMTLQQRIALQTILTVMDVEEMHHGCCVGVDAEAHELAMMMKALGHKIRVHGHPCTLGKYQAKLTGFDNLYVPTEAITRNHHIVKASDFIFAAPRTRDEEQRSGTWATIRYAYKSDADLLVVAPNGEMRFGRTVWELPK